MPRPLLSVGQEAPYAPCIAAVSLGFMPRPLLSEVRTTPKQTAARRVAGVYAPAFVERGQHGYQVVPCGGVSLGFMPRPLLSDEDKGIMLRVFGSVAGVYAPAFVERSAPLIGMAQGRYRVAGVYAPAFVERVMLPS